MGYLHTAASLSISSPSWSVLVDWVQSYSGASVADIGRAEIEEKDAVERTARTIAAIFIVCHFKTS